jgi:hypothetical protein
LILSSLSSCAEPQFHRIGELRQVAAEDQEIGRWVHGLHVLDRTHRLFDEARVHLARVQVGVGDPGEAELRFRRVGDVDGVDQRKPAVGPGCDRPAGQQRSVQEDTAADVHARVRALARPAQLPVHLVS